MSQLLSISFVCLTFEMLNPLQLNEHNSHNTMSQLLSILFICLTFEMLNPLQLNKHNSHW